MPQLDFSCKPWELSENKFFFRCHQLILLFPGFLLSFIAAEDIEGRSLFNPLNSRAVLVKEEPPGWYPELRAGVLYADGSSEGQVSKNNTYRDDDWFRPLGGEPKPFIGEESSGDAAIITVHYVDLTSMKRLASEVQRQEEELAGGTGFVSASALRVVMQRPMGPPVRRKKRKKQGLT